MKSNIKTTYEFTLELTKEEANMVQEALNKAWSFRKEHERVIDEKIEDGQDVPKDYVDYCKETDFIRDMRNLFANTIGIHYMGIDA